MLRRVPEVDIVMGPQFANQISSLLDQAEVSQVCATDHISVSGDEGFFFCSWSQCSMTEGPEYVNPLDTLPTPHMS